MQKDLRKAEEKEKWREKVNNRERLKNIATVKYRKMLRNQPQPFNRETRGRTIIGKAAC